MNYALNKPYQRLCMSRDLNGQRTKRAVHISVCLSSKRCGHVQVILMRSDYLNPQFEFHFVHIFIDH